MLKAGLAAAIYVRASTDEQAITTDAQRAQLHELAREHGLLVIADFEDKESGTRRPGLPMNKRTGLPSTHPRAKMRRPGLAGLLDAVRRQTVKVVMFTDLTRLARHNALQADLLEAFRLAGVMVLTTEGMIVQRKANDRMFNQMRGVFAEHYAAYIGERTKDALAHLRAQGRSYNRVAPYGFRLVPDPALPRTKDGRIASRLERVPHEQKVLARLFELRAGGKSLRDVAAELNAKGYTTRKGTPWHFAYVHHYERQAQQRAQDVA